MSKGLKISVFLFSVMTMSAIAAKALTPTVFMAKERPAFRIDEIIPKKFEGWREVRSGVAGVVNPQAEATLNKIYSQLLSRTYVHDSGAMVMLSIAYGEDQRSDMAVHYPEVCYPAQGFQVKSISSGEMNMFNISLPIKKLETVMGGQRYEPVTYWTTIGEYTSVDALEKRVIELRYGAKGYIPDGVLFRVSSIGKDSASAFQAHSVFIRDLIRSVSPEARSILIGVKSIAAS